MSWVEVWGEGREQPLLDHVRRCESFVCRLRGLTFRRRLAADEGLLLVGSRQSRVDTTIHMFFVFFPIAVVWLNTKGRIVDRRLARPFRPLYVPQSPARDVLEGPPSLLERVHVGEHLRIREVSHA